MCVCVCVCMQGGLSKSSYIELPCYMLQKGKGWESYKLGLFIHYICSGAPRKRFIYLFNKS